MKKKTRNTLIVLLVIIVLILVIAVVLKSKAAAKNVAPKTFENVQVAEPETASSDVGPALGRTGWLEMPGRNMTDAEHMHCSTHFAEMNGTLQRNYSFLYDEERFTSYWVAYPLCPSHMGAGRVESWSYDPNVGEENQTSVSSGYGASYATRCYKKNHYARGHQMPNADRNNVPEMMAQTYYSTNMTPQIQNGFNGAIWKTLEEACREAVHADTLYMVTGASFNKIGENLEIETIVNKNDHKQLPVPNYYWKVMLKVIRNESGLPVKAETIGFWLPHEELKGHQFTEYAVPVDQIEEWTGFDFFVNLPDELEDSAEKLDDWSAFSVF